MKGNCFRKTKCPQCSRSWFSWKLAVTVDCYSYKYETFPQACRRCKKEGLALFAWSDWQNFIERTLEKAMQPAGEYNPMFRQTPPHEAKLCSYCKIYGPNRH